MDQQKTQQLRSALVGLIPASERSHYAGVDSSKVVLKQPATTAGVEAAKTFVRNKFHSIRLTMKNDAGGDRLYVYFQSRLARDRALETCKANSVTVRNVTNGFVFDNVSKFKQEAETFDEFVVRAKTAIDLINSVTRTSPISVTYKKHGVNDPQRLYVYFNTNKNQLLVLQNIRDAIIKQFPSANTTSIGAYGLNMRLDYNPMQLGDSTLGVPQGEAVAPTEADLFDPAPAAANKLLAGLSNDDMFDHIEKLRGRVSDKVLEQMKEALRASLPKPQWKWNDFAFIVELKSGVTLDLNQVYTLCTTLPQTPQHFSCAHVKAGDAVLASTKNPTITFYKNRLHDDTMYVVIRNEAGVHNHTSIKRV